MIEVKLKHLEFIQNVIARMNSCSFLIKGWAVTLVSALFALSASGSNPNYVLISYFVIPVFWMLDGFFLSVEKSYRGLYDDVSKRENGDVNLSMNASSFKVGKNTWIRCIFSKTLVPFYGVTLFITILVMYFFGR